MGLLVDMVEGGRIICSADVHKELRQGYSEVYEYFRWQSAARRPVRDDPLPRDKPLVDQTVHIVGKAYGSIRGIKDTLSRRRKHGFPWECLYDDAQVLLNAPFERVFASEIRNWVEQSRKARHAEEKIPFPERPHLDNALVGLALSGGGMRSGVFSLGVVQALADYSFLKDIDYMSTVSGGGYTGSAVSALTAEELPYQDLTRLGATRETFPFSFPRPDGNGLRPYSPVHGNESPALKHVRENTALYGTKPGLFDARSWIIAGRYLVSTLLLLALFLLPVVTFVGVVGIAFRHWMNSPGSAVTLDFRDASAVLFLTSATLLFLHLFHRWCLRPQVILSYFSFLVSAFASVFAAVWIVISFSDLDRLGSDPKALIAVLPPLVFFVTLLLLSDKRTAHFVSGSARVLAYAGAVVAFLTAVVWIFGSVTNVDEIEQLWKDELILLGVLSPLLVFAASAVISNLTDEPSPKWLQAIALPITRVAPFAAGALALMLLASGGVYLFDWLVEPRDSERTIARFAAGATAASGAISTVVSLNKLWGMKQTQSMAWTMLLGLGGYVVLGLVITTWIGLLFLHTDRGAQGDWVVGIIIVSGVVLLVTLLAHPLGRGILNYCSLHRIYAAMLAKTWVIAALPERIKQANQTNADANRRQPVGPGGANELPRWTRVWMRDDIRMSHLRENAEPQGKADRPSGPYHLICTALNLPGSTSTKLLDRKSDSFVIAPLRSGSAVTRWVETRDHDELNQLRLSQAAAISGAAISPNSGEHTSRTFSIMTTLLNARLGRWIRNPRPSQNPTVLKWLADTPFLLYWKEMFGLASHDDGQIYLSDGGHFENMGLYELFRRRCKYIIAVSADTGPLSKQFDLGNIGKALRLARVDFGVEVTLGAFRPLVRDLKTGFVKTYYAAGHLEYRSEADHSDDKGVFILIKTGLCGDDLPLDIAQYSMDGHPAFPYDSTLNQQYDQPIFESYRRLGYLAAETMCKSAGAGATPKARFDAVRNAYAMPTGGPDGDDGGGAGGSDGGREAESSDGRRGGALAGPASQRDCCTTTAPVAPTVPAEESVTPGS